MNLEGFLNWDQLLQLAKNINSNYAATMSSLVSKFNGRLSPDQVEELFENSILLRSKSKLEVDAEKLPVIKRLEQIKKMVDAGVTGEIIAQLIRHYPKDLSEKSFCQLVEITDEYKSDEIVGELLQKSPFDIDFQLIMRLAKISSKSFNIYLINSIRNHDLMLSYDELFSVYLEFRQKGFQKLSAKILPQFLQELFSCLDENPISIDQVMRILDYFPNDYDLTGPVLDVLFSRVDKPLEWENVVEALERGGYYHFDSTSRILQHCSRNISFNTLLKNCYKFRDSNRWEYGLVDLLIEEISSDQFYEVFVTYYNNVNVSHSSFALKLLERVRGKLNTEQTVEIMQYLHLKDESNLVIAKIFEISEADLDLVIERLWLGLSDLYSHQSKLNFLIGYLAFMTHGRVDRPIILADQLK